MFKCIFCLNKFDDSKKTEEHVFPEAIGGSFSIFNLCKPCNDKLGANADSHLINNLFIFNLIILYVLMFEFYLFRGYYKVFHKGNNLLYST